MVHHFENPNCHEGSKLALDESIVLLKKMEKALPKYKGYTLVDVTAKCRQGQEEWEKEEHDGGITIHILYWLLYRMSTCKMQLEDYAGTISYANRALSLLPPLAKEEGAIPSPYEIACFQYKARAHAAAGSSSKQANNQAALAIHRACMAATRLHLHINNKNHPTGQQTHGLNFLLKKCDKVILQIIRYGILTKMDKQTHRPYFTVDELNELEKELGIGIFSKFHYKCSGCGKPRSAVKLFPCSSCRRVWYCCRGCQVADWKKGGGGGGGSAAAAAATGDGHKNRCGEKWRFVPFLALESSDLIDSMAARSDRRVHMIVAPPSDSIIPYCRDEKTGKSFHGLTDQPIYSEK